MDISIFTANEISVFFPNRAILETVYRANHKWSAHLWGKDDNNNLLLILSTDPVFEDEDDAADFIQEMAKEYKKDRQTALIHN